MTRPSIQIVAAPRTRAHRHERVSHKPNPTGAASRTVALEDAYSKARGALAPRALLRSCGRGCQRRRPAVGALRVAARAAGATGTALCAACAAVTSLIGVGQSMGTGQANVKTYNRQLRDLIHVGKAQPSLLVSHNLDLADAPDAYRHFDNHEDGWTKIVLNPTNG